MNETNGAALTSYVSARWRAIARGAPPWTAYQRDGVFYLSNTRQGGLLGTLEGQWAPGIASYLNAIHPYAGLTLAELLWNIGGHGTAAAIQTQAFTLLTTMGLTTLRTI